MRRSLRIAGLGWLAIALLLGAGGCQEYATLADTGVLEDGEPAAEEDDRDCDGGACGEDEETPQDCCGTDDGRDGGPDDGPDGLDDGADAGCQIPDPQPLELALCDPPWGCELSENGPATVLYATRPVPGEPSVVWLLWAGSRVPIRLRARLPSWSELPLALDDRVVAECHARSPWWTDQRISVYAPDGLLLYRQEDRSLSLADPRGRCPAEPDTMGCGLWVRPLLEDQDPPLEQGLDTVIQRAEGSYRLWVGELWHYLTMECDDVPMGWLQVAELTRVRRSACRCDGPADCARDEICEPYARACVKNPCVVMDCAPGYLCDPFRGECVPQPAWGCLTDADCDEGEICHPITGACLEDFCRNIDCAPCSPLLGGCYGCLADCECGDGLCDRERRACVDGCLLDKLDLALRQENPSAYELYYACLEDALDDPGALVQLFEPGALCGIGGPPGGCPNAAPVACLVPLERYSGGSMITNEAWGRLCHLSRNPLVHRMIGGYYLP